MCAILYYQQFCIHLTHTDDHFHQAVIRAEVLQDTGQLL